MQQQNTGSKNGEIFVVTNGFLGVTSAAAWLSPVAAAAATCLSLWNSSSVHDLYVIETRLTYFSGTVEVGNYVYNHHWANQNITATANAVTKCLSLDTQSTGTAAVGVGRGFSNTAITGGAAGFEGMPIGSFVNTAGTSIVHDVNGLIKIPPYCMLTIGAPTNGTSAVIGASITYRQVAR